MDQPNPEQLKQRHGCLTAVLVLMIIANSLTAIFYLFSGSTAARSLPQSSEWALPVLIILGLFNVACAIALLRWKKWGFYGFLLSTIVTFTVNVAIGLNIFQSILGFLGIAVLYWVLQIGKEKKGWDQLE